MSRSRSTYTEQLERLLDACFAELQGMSDQDVLDGESPVAVRERAVKRLEWARAEAGRRRLATAKREMERRGARPMSIVDITAAKARAYIVQAAASSRVTLAARKLDEMSDEDVLRLYQQIRELEADSSKSE